ncbi:hypothetical protein CAAN1_11S00144 [[Candida] anglica]|uniref:Uncharacterized protein n=1 Tax=[Candida] anglica TaxID=148631 RepID=A0ABP0EIC7_9ASCO
MKFSTIASLFSIAAFASASIDKLSPAACPILDTDLEDFFLVIGENEWFFYLGSGDSNVLHTLLINSDAEGKFDFWIGENAIKDCSCYPNTQPDYSVAPGEKLQLELDVTPNMLYGVRVKGISEAWDIVSSPVSHRWGPTVPIEKCPRK